jgi:O-acetyl-ADP-ribose deacetylase (regulator of RNase III)
MIIFAEKNKDLKKLFKESFPDIGVTDDMFAYPEPKNIVTCSNKWLSMGGGIDAVIAKKYPKECAQAKEQLGKGTMDDLLTPFRIGSVVFAVTVDDQFKADPKAIKKALSFIFNRLKDHEETFIFTGMGTGIGGLSPEDFIKLCKEAHETN